MGAGVTDVVGPDGASVLKVNDFRGRVQPTRDEYEGR
jgi:hypothetical protein